MVAEYKTNGDKMNNVRCENSRTYRNKRKEYMKRKTDESVSNCKNKTITLIQRHK
jgi:hypothetical protein